MKFLLSQSGVAQKLDYLSCLSEMLEICQYSNIVNFSLELTFVYQEDFLKYHQVYLSNISSLIRHGIV